MEPPSKPRRFISQRSMIIIGVLVLILLVALGLVLIFPGFDAWNQDYIQTVVPRL